MDLPKALFAKSIHLLIVVTLTMFTVSISCADSPPAASTQEKRHLIAVIPADTAPTSYKNKMTDKAEGFAVEALDIIAARLGFQITYQFVNNWDEVLAKVTRGEADIAPDMAITPERSKLLDFTTPLEVIPLRYFVRSNNSWSEQQLRQSNIGVMKGSAAYELLKKHGAKLVNYNTYINGIYDLLAGKIDAFVGPQPTIWKLILDARLEERITTTGKPLAEIKRCIAVRKGNNELLAKLEPSVQELIASPELPDA